MYPFKSAATTAGGWGPWLPPGPGSGLPIAWLLPAPELPVPESLGPAPAKRGPAGPDISRYKRSSLCCCIRVRQKRNRLLTESFNQKTLQPETCILKGDVSTKSILKERNEIAHTQIERTENIERDPINRIELERIE